MKSTKFIEWETGLKLGDTIYRIISPSFISYTKDSFIPIIIDEQKEPITFTHRFNVAPKLIDAAIHKANRIFNYYTFKQLPGAVIFLGSK